MLGAPRQTCWMNRETDQANGLGPQCSVDVVYCDFSKGFDVVPHRRLLAKCDGLGIRGKVIKWVEEWLTGRKQRVVLNGQASD